MNTNSLMPFDEEGFEIICGIIERLEDEDKIFDVELLKEYNNIIFDCDEKIQDYIVAFLQISFPDLDWQITVNEGERILKILTYMDGELSVEDINKTFDEIAKESKAVCEGDCSSCKRDCGGCEEHQCAFKIDVEAETASVEEMSSEAFDEYFAELCDSLYDNLDEYCDDALQDICEDIISDIRESSQDAHDAEGCEPVEDPPDYEDVYDLFFALLAKVLLAAAGSGGCYTEKKHSYIERLTGALDFEKAKSAALNPNMDMCIETMRFWNDAEKHSECNVRMICVMLCIMLCCCDSKADAEEKAFLKRLANAE